MHGRYDPFLSMDKEAWVAYSWLFELMFMGWSGIGMAGLVIYTAVLRWDYFALLMLIRKIEQNAGIAIGLTALGFLQWAVLQTPRLVIAILLFILEWIYCDRPQNRKLSPFASASFPFCAWATLIFSSFTGSCTGVFLMAPWSEQALRRPFQLTILNPL